MSLHSANHTNRPRATEQTTQAHHILMGVHEHKKPILLRYAQHFDGELDPVVVINPRSSMLYCLPSKDVSNRVISPFSQSCKVRMCILQRKRPANKGDIVAVEEPIRSMRRNIGAQGILGVASKVDSAYSDLPVLTVSKYFALDTEPEGRSLRHDACVRSRRRAGKQKDRIVEPWKGRKGGLNTSQGVTACVACCVLRVLGSNMYSAQFTKFPEILNNSAVNI